MGFSSVFKGLSDLVWKSWSSYESVTWRLGLSKQTFKIELLQIIKIGYDRIWVTSNNNNQ